MNRCPYCGHENNSGSSDCADCGTSLSGDAPPAGAAKGKPFTWPSLLVAVAASAGTLVLMVVVAMGSLAFLIRGCNPPTPRDGFRGEWRSFSVVRVEERPLPPASNVWAAYDAWQPKTNPYSSRVFVARLGLASRQSRFRCSTNYGDTPMGGYYSTYIEFHYHDPTNGEYALSWSMRGEHSPDFLRFNDNFRLYQLEPFGDRSSPRVQLNIRAIEGMKAWH